MKSMEEIKSNLRLNVIEDYGEQGLAAYYKHPRYKTHQMLIVFSCDRGWEHASISLKNRCPTWDEMCSIKDIFWNEDEAVMQIHPPKADYVNLYPYCLHLWKPVNGEITRPPKELVY